jgi:hypothetical protein
MKGNTTKKLTIPLFLDIIKEGNAVFEECIKDQNFNREFDYLGTTYKVIEVLESAAQYRNITISPVTDSVTEAKEQMTVLLEKFYLAVKGNEELHNKIFDEEKNYFLKAYFFEKGFDESDKKTEQQPTTTKSTTNYNIGSKMRNNANEVNKQKGQAIYSELNKLTDLGNISANKVKPLLDRLSAEGGIDDLKAYLGEHTAVEKKVGFGLRGVQSASYLNKAISRIIALRIDDADGTEAPCKGERYRIFDDIIGTDNGVAFIKAVEDMTNSQAEEVPSNTSTASAKKDDTVRATTSSVSSVFSRLSSSFSGAKTSEMSIKDLLAKLNAVKDTKKLATAPGNEIITQLNIAVADEAKSKAFFLLEGQSNLELEYINKAYEALLKIPNDTKDIADIKHFFDIITDIKALKMGDRTQPSIDGIVAKTQVDRQAERQEASTRLVISKPEDIEIERSKLYLSEAEAFNQASPEGKIKLANIAEAALECYSLRDNFDKNKKNIDFSKIAILKELVLEDAAEGKDVTVQDRLTQLSTEYQKGKAVYDLAKLPANHANLQLKYAVNSRPKDQSSANTHGVIAQKADTQNLTVYLSYNQDKRKATLLSKEQQSKFEKFTAVQSAITEGNELVKQLFTDVIEGINPIKSMNRDDDDGLSIDSYIDPNQQRATINPHIKTDENTEILRALITSIAQNGVTTQSKKTLNSYIEGNIQGVTLDQTAELYVEVLNEKKDGKLNQDQYKVLIDYLQELGADFKTLVNEKNWQVGSAAASTSASATKDASLTDEKVAELKQVINAAFTVLTDGNKKATIAVRKQLYKDYEDVEEPVPGEQLDNLIIDHVNGLDNALDANAIGLLGEMAAKYQSPYLVGNIVAKAFPVTEVTEVTELSDELKGYRKTVYQLMGGDAHDAIKAKILDRIKTVPLDFDAKLLIGVLNAELDADIAIPTKDPVKTGGGASSNFSTSVAVNNTQGAVTVVQQNQSGDEEEEYEGISSSDDEAEKFDPNTDGLSSASRAGNNAHEKVVATEVAVKVNANINRDDDEIIQEEEDIYQLSDYTEIDNLFTAAKTADDGKLTFSAVAIDDKGQKNLHQFKLTKLADGKFTIEDGSDDDVTVEDIAVVNAYAAKLVADFTKWKDTHKAQEFIIQSDGNEDIDITEDNFIQSYIANPNQEFQITVELERLDLRKENLEANIADLAKVEIVPKRNDDLTEFEITQPEVIAFLTGANREFDILNLQPINIDLGADRLGDKFKTRCDSWKEAIATAKALAEKVEALKPEFKADYKEATFADIKELIAANEALRDSITQEEFTIINASGSLAAAWQVKLQAIEQTQERQAKEQAFRQEVVVQVNRLTSALKSVDIGSEDYINQAATEKRTKCLDNSLENKAVKDQLEAIDTQERTELVAYKKQALADVKARDQVNFDQIQTLCIDTLQRNYKIISDNINGPKAYKQDTFKKQIEKMEGNIANYRKAYASQGENSIFIEGFKEALTDSIAIQFTGYATDDLYSGIDGLKAAYQARSESKKAQISPIAYVPSTPSRNQLNRQIPAFTTDSIQHSKKLIDSGNVSEASDNGFDDVETTKRGGVRGASSRDDGGKLLQQVDSFYEDGYISDGSDRGGISSSSRDGISYGRAGGGGSSSSRAGGIEGSGYGISSSSGGNRFNQQNQVRGYGGGASSSRAGSGSGYGGTSSSTNSRGEVRGYGSVSSSSSIDGSGQQNQVRGYGGGASSRRDEYGQQDQVSGYGRGNRGDQQNRSGYGGVRLSSGRDGSGISSSSRDGSVSSSYGRAGGQLNQGGSSHASKEVHKRRMQPKDPSRY